MIPANLSVLDFTYELPEERIALYPAVPRDSSRLLAYEPSTGAIGGFMFQALPELLPGEGIMVFNETRVVHARLIFQKPTGGRVEIFCLSPTDPPPPAETAFQAKGPVRWKAYVGNARRWKEEVLQMPFRSSDSISGLLEARRKGRMDDAFEVEFSWEPSSLTFSEVLEAAGKVPLPPYIHREAVAEDVSRYQTVYAKADGSVAAPTAGLHFTPALLEQLESGGRKRLEVVLHVGAGTFKPVGEGNIHKHMMHTEEIQVSHDTLTALVAGYGKPIIAVGTTTVRTLESLYQTGKKLIQNIPFEEAVHTAQWDPYQGYQPDTEEALAALLEEMNRRRLHTFRGTTTLMIVPGYNFRLTDILITNFHQPRSTLLMLVAAFCGPGWRTAYQYALDTDFRFLSYGDACLFYKSR